MGLEKGACLDWVGLLVDRGVTGEGRRGGAMGEESGVGVAMEGWGYGCG